MKLTGIKTLAWFTVLAAVLLSAGCAKKVAKVTPPPPPAPQPAPTVTLAANPSVVQPGQASTLTWQTSHANEVTIAGLGTVPASGSRTVTPNASTTYTLMATGPGGSNEASANVTVNVPVAAVAAPTLTDEELFSRNVKDVFFDYDKYVIRPDEAPVVHNDEAFLAQHPSVKVLVEGHCDDRGSEEYNIALGASRAESLKQALVTEGVPADRIRTVSYGEEKPFCTEDNEQCWQQNRRDHFAFERD
jgi:peptidoglycan-associated lipoprotein